MNALSIWTGYFSNFPPKAYLLRDPLSARWLRIHSLPGSKRYPNTEQEYLEMLTRHNRVSCEILGTSQDAILFAPVWDDVDLSKFDWAARAGLTKSEPITFQADDEDEPPMVIVGNRVEWTEGVWDDLLRDVADDRVADIVLLNPNSGEVYAPYDGGADVFGADHQRATMLKERWSSWLSSHPAGL